MVTMTDLMPRVEKGAAWLDVNRPGWFDAINCDELNIESCSRCVLGQLFGSFDDGMARLVEGYDEWAYNPASGEHGFAAKQCDLPIDTPRDASKLFWRTLRECWMTAILARQFATLEAAQESPASVPVEAVCQR